MKLWTIQPLEFYNKLIAEGEIRTTETYTEPDYKNAYKWMINEMENRIGKRPHRKVYPIWAWYQYKNIKSRKPDLRNNGFLTRGTKGVRIEFQKPKNQVLLSDFNLWHFSLNNWYIPDDEKQESEFKELLKVSKAGIIKKDNKILKIKQITEQSWKKIFDMNYDCDYVTDSFNDKKIQATFWNLKSSEISKVDFFIAK
jgi:hypothetical protein